MNPLLALAIATAVAVVAWLLRTLSNTGAIAAALVGVSILTYTGWEGLAVLGTFFVGSALVSRLASLGQAPSDQGDTEVRGWRQVVANGGVAGLAAFLEPYRAGLGVWLVAIALAAAASDTWATAFGRLSRRPPVDLFRWQPVTPGTSGGVTWFGTIGGVVGAALVALVAATATKQLSIYLAATAIGFLAMLVDSALGSAVQARFHCDGCGVPTEQRRHRCGVATRHVRGWRWLDNDGVNGLATTSAALLGWVVWPR